MKKIMSCGLLVLISTLIFSGVTNVAQAQTDPIILLKIAKHAQEQLQNQIDHKSSDKTKQLFTEGIQQVVALEKSILNEDITSAKEHFLHAMKIFKQVSQQLINNPPSQKETISANTITQDPSANLLRIQDYVDNLKIIAAKYSSSIDFSELDELFIIAKKQITNQQIDDALQTIHQIKQIIMNINNEIRQHASQQEQSSAKEYAQRYIKQLDRLIENAKNQGVSQSIIQKLETARESLSSTTDPNEIIKQIREIISIKEQFQLTKIDLALDTNEPTKETKSTKEEKPTKETKSTKEEKPTKETKSTKEEKPTKETKSTKEEKPTKETKSTKEEKPTKETKN